MTLSFADFTAGDVLEAAVAKAQSLSDLLDKRSPGERTAAQLTKTKHARALAKLHSAPKQVAPPPETALASILMGPPEPLPIELATAPLVPGPPPVLEAVIGSPGGGGSIIAPPGGGGTIVGPPGGDTPQSNPKDTREPVIDTPPPSVPEPATWAMMLLGFGLIGWQVRYAPRNRLAVA